MAGLAALPGLGDGKYNDATWARRSAMSLPAFRVRDAASWAPSVNTGAVRTINVAAGAAEVCGVYEETDGVGDSVQFPANDTGGDRFDVLVARVDWPTGKRTFEYVLGTGAYPPINAVGAVQDGAINRLPGIRYDAVLAAIRVRPGWASPFEPADIFSDLRVWGSAGGAVRTNTYNNRGLLDLSVGELLHVSPDLPFGASTGGRVLERVEAGWRQISPAVIGTYTSPFATRPLLRTTSEFWAVDDFTVPDPGVPFRASVEVAMEGGAEAAGTRYDFVAGHGAFLSSAQLVEHQVTILNMHLPSTTTQKLHQVSRPTGVLTGAKTWRITGRRIFGSGAGLISAVNKSFVVTYYAA